MADGTADGARELTSDLAGGAWAYPDVCVVGAGPAGLLLAHELSASGLHVLVLEGGPAAPPVGGVDVTSTTSTGLPYSPVATRSSGVGGSSLRWTVETPLGPGFVRLKELDASDFEPRDLLGVSGWPFGRAELEPHYDRAREVLGLPPRDETRDTGVGGVLERRVYGFTPATVFTHDLPAVLRSRPTVRLAAGWTVTDVRTDGASEAVTSLTCRSATGARASVRARAFVLAGGGIENARLLLASRSRYADGLGNHHDLVGRYFMEHPHYVSGVLRGRPTAPPTAWDLVAPHGTIRQEKYVLAPSVRAAQGVLDAVYKVKPFTAARLPLGHDGRLDQEGLDAWTGARDALRGYSRVSGVTQASRPSPVAWAELVRATPAVARHAGMRLADRVRSGVGRPPVQRHGHRVMVMAEQEPSPLSRLRLTDALDPFGVPRAELDWRLTPLDRHSMVRGQQLAAPDLARVVGAAVVTTLGPDGALRPDGGAHHIGTTRMSRSPRSGVVDEDCRVHGVPNLFVTGSSVFPVGGAANPTLTILALASRLAHRLAAELAVTGARGTRLPRVSSL